MGWVLSKFDSFLFLELRGGRTGVLSVCTVHLQDVHSGIFCRSRKIHSRVLFKIGALDIPRGSSGLGSSFHSLLVPFLVGDLRSSNCAGRKKKKMAREPGGLPSMGSHRVRHDWSDLAAAGLFDKLPSWVKVSQTALTGHPKSNLTIPSHRDPREGVLEGFPGEEAGGEQHEALGASWAYLPHEISLHPAMRNSQLNSAKGESSGSLHNWIFEREKEHSAQSAWKSSTLLLKSWKCCEWEPLGQFPPDERQQVWWNLRLWGVAHRSTEEAVFSDPRAHYLQPSEQGWVSLHLDL